MCFFYIFPGEARKPNIFSAAQVKPLGQGLGSWWGIDVIAGDVHLIQARHDIYIYE